MSQDLTPIEADSLLPKISFTDLQKQVEQGTITESELDRFFLEVPQEETSLEPKLRLNPEKVELPPEEVTLESALLMNTANAWCNHLRRLAYRRKVAAPGGDKLIRVMAEGDSWFQYPIKLHDTIDHLMDRPDVAVRCFSAAGDVLSNMVARPQFIDAILSERPHYFLISGGGNDLVDGQGLRDLLHPFDPNLQPADYRNDAYQDFKARLARLYKDLFAMVHREDPKLRIICHGYSYAIPNSDRGPWLGRPMEDLGITDRAIQFAIMKVIVNDINATISSTANSAASGPVSYVDVRAIVPADGWHDEFHPTSHWFGKIATELGKLIV